MTAETFSNPQLVIDTLPDFRGIAYDSLAKAAPWVPFWPSLILFGVLTIVDLVLLLVTPLPSTAAITMLAVLWVLFALIQWHNFAGHKIRGVAARTHDIVFKKGLFWRKTKLVPFRRVQHIEIHRNPIERKLGLSSLKIFTAGGSGVDLNISGLENDRAEKIKQYILEKTKSGMSDQ